MRPLTERQAAVLAYVVEHPGCTTKDIELAFCITKTQARQSAEVLYTMRLLARQSPMLHGRSPQLWFPENKGIALIEHGSGQADASGLQAPAVAQGAGVSAPALLPGVTA